MSRRPFDEQALILAACQGICLLLGVEAVMRIDSCMVSDEYTESHKRWMKLQRELLVGFLEALDETK